MGGRCVSQGLDQVPVQPVLPLVRSARCWLLSHLSRLLEAGQAPPQVREEPPGAAACARERSPRASQGPCGKGRPNSLGLLRPGCCHGDHQAFPINPWRREASLRGGDGDGDGDGRSLL